MKQTLFAPLAVLTLLAGCGPALGGGGGDAGVGRGKGPSCTASDSTQSYCIAFTGSTWAGGSDKEACTMISGVYSTEGCAPGSLGVCTYSKGQAAEIKQTYYSYSSAQGLTVEAACTKAGATYSAN